MTTPPVFHTAWLAAMLGLSAQAQAFSGEEFYSEPFPTSCCESRSSSGCDNDPLEATICAADPYCCNVRWDSLCVAAADAMNACCPETTAELCVDPEYIDSACGQQMVQETNVAQLSDAPHVCLDALQSGFESARAGLATVPVMTAPMTTFWGSVRQPEVDETLALKDDDLKPARRGSGGFYDFDSWLTRYWLGYYDRAGQLTPHRVGSCREYVWEKYWDLGRYEQATSDPSMSDRQRVAIAFGHAFATTSVGTRAIAGEVLRGKGELRDVRLVQNTTTRPKNKFLDLGGAWTATDGIALAPSIATLLRAEYDALAPSERDGHPWGLVSAYFGSGALVADRHVTPDFSWHRAMNAEFADVFDEKLETMYGRQANFGTLVVEVNATIAEWYAYEQRYQLMDGTMGCGDTLTTAGGCIDDPSLNLSRLEKLRAKKNHALESVKAWLSDAKEWGCLEAGPTVCDWAPSAFVSEMARQYVEQRERDLAECQQTTQNVSFTQLNGYRFPYYSTIAWTLRYPRDYTASTSAFELYMKNHKAYLEGLLNAVAEDFTITNNALKVAEASNASGNKGDEWFGLRHAIDHDWEFIPGEAPSCGEATLTGSFTAHARLLQSELQLVDANVTLATHQQGQLLFSVAGVQEPILNESWDSPSNHIEQSYSLADGSWKSDEKHLVEKTTLAHFNVLGVPVSIKGGVTGFTQLDYKADVGLNCPEHGDKNLALTANLTPMANATGYITVGVDYVVLEAGIKGELTLIQAELPLDVAIAVTAVENGMQSELRLDIAAEADLVLRTMGGRIALFAEILGAEYDKTLVTWRGITSTHDLFETQSNFPLVGLQELCDTGMVNCD